MKHLLILSIIVSLAVCKAGFLGAEIPDLTSKVLNLTLDGKFSTTGFVNSLGDISVPFDLTNIYSYFTSPQCMNCQIYGDGEQQPFICSNENFCNVQQGGFQGQSIDTYYQANSALIQMQMKFDGVPAYVSQVLYVKSINQIKEGQSYDFQNIGLAIDEQNTSFLLYSLKEQGKIDNYSYSFYYGQDFKYHMQIGGFNFKLLSKQFYNLRNFQAPSQVPYNIQNDFLYAKFSVNGQQVIQERKVYLDPTIDTFEFPFSDMYAFQNAYLAQSIMPDQSDLSFQQPGQWSSLKLSPSLTVSFEINDKDSPNHYLDVQFPAEEFMTKTAQGNYTPNMVYIDRNDLQFQGVVIMGKQIFQKLMYYKYVDTKANTTIRCLAPLKNVKKSSQ